MNQKNKSKGFKSSISIIKNLPAIQQLSRSNFHLKRFEAAWRIWQEKYPNFSANLIAFESGHLIIECENQLVATQLKHQNSSLLRHFNNHRIKEIDSIKLVVAKKMPKKALSHNNSNQTAQDQTSQTNPKLKERPQPNHQSLEELGKLRDAIKN